MSVDAGTGLRERKKARTRRALRSAALTRARLQGPDGFTLEEVCADAEVSPRTFFNYFPGKDAALFDWDDESVSALEAAVRGRDDDEPLAAVVGVVAELAEALTTSPTWHEQIELLRAHPGVAGRMSQVSRTVETALARAVDDRAAERGEPADHLGAHAAAAIAMAALHVALTAWLADPAGSDVRSLYREVLARARTAFGALPGGDGTRRQGNESPDRRSETSNQDGRHVPAGTS